MMDSRKRVVQTNNTFIICLSLTAALGSFNGGYQIGVLNSLYDFFREKYHWGDDSAFIWKWVNTITLATAALVALMGSAIGGWLGKRKMALLANVFTIIASVVIQGNSTAYMLIARGIFGISMGLYFYIAAGYLREVGPHKDSGKYISLHQLNIVVAIFLGALFSLALPGSDNVAKISQDNFYRIVLSFPIVIAVLQILLLLFVFSHDTPKGEYMSKKEDVSRSILSKMYKSQQEVDSILSIYAKEVIIEQKASTSLGVLVKMYWKLALVGCFISFVQQLSGINSIMYYSTPMLKVLTGNENKAKAATVCIDATQVFFTFVGLLLVDKVGRKVLFIIGCIGCAIAQIIFGFLYDEDKILNSKDYWSFVMLMVFIAFFSISLGPVTWVYIGETMHAKPTNIVLFINLLFNILVTLLSPDLASKALFITYGGILLVSAVIFKLFVPETTGLNDLEIKKVFNVIENEGANEPLVESKDDKAKNP